MLCFVGCPWQVFVLISTAHCAECCIWGCASARALCSLCVSLSRLGAWRAACGCRFVFVCPENLCSGRSSPSRTRPIHPPPGHRSHGDAGCAGVGFLGVVLERAATSTVSARAVAPGDDGARARPFGGGLLSSRGGNKQRRFCHAPRACYFSSLPGWVDLGLSL